MSEYWRICAEEALDEAGLLANDDQINTIAQWMESGASEYGEQHGHAEASKSLYSEQAREIDRLKKLAQDEVDKVPCPECEGKWAPGLNGTTEPARWTCWKCDGTGKVAPHLGRTSR